MPLFQHKNVMHRRIQHVLVLMGPASRPMTAVERNIFAANTEKAFQEMAPLTIGRLQERGKQSVKEWMNTPALCIDYINTFSRVESHD